MSKQRKRIIAAKGGPKTIMGSNLNAEQKAKTRNNRPLASKDAPSWRMLYRIQRNEYPKIREISFRFVGLVVSMTQKPIFNM
jgi:hypothetical protein